MGEEAPLNPAEYLLDVKETFKAVSQFLENQKALGNTGIELSDESRELLAAMGRPAVAAAPVRNSRPRPRPGSPPERPRTGPPSKGGQIPLKFQGPETASLYFVDGEGDLLNGDAGALLGKIIAAMKLDPNQVFICDIANRPALMEKIRTNSPQIIVSLGEAATRHLLQTRDGAGKYLGRFTFLANARIMPTHHPRQLLQDPSLKRQVWENMKTVMAALGSGDAG